MSVKRIDIKELRSGGYLQEVNRRFFHPLGMALEVIIDDETGEEKFGGVWDYRNDPEGVIYACDIVLDPEFKNKAQKIAKELRLKRMSREKLLGFFIQPTEGA